MERTIFDIMSDDPSRVNEFKRATDEMLATQYILADGRVSAILKAIATSRELYSLFDRLLLKFDYKTVAKSCMCENNTKIKLPSGAEDTAAFIFCVLLDIDKRNIELKDFLNFFQNGEDTAYAYKNFLKEFIAPFRNSVLGLVEAERQKQNEKQSAAQREDERRRLELNFDRFMGTFIARINSSDIGTILKDELTVLCGDFSDSVHSGDAKESKNAYTRLIRKLKLHMPALAKELEKFDIDNM